MKNLRKILIVLLAVLTVLSVSAAVFAEEPKGTDDPGENSGEILTTGAEPAATENPIPEGYSIGLFVLDGEGNTVNDKSSFSCFSSGVNLYIKHDYQIAAKYYKSTGETLEPDIQYFLGIEDETGNVTLEHNRIYLKASDKPYSFTIRMIDTTKENGETSYPVSVKRFKFEFTDIFAVGVGVYVIFTAIRGTGALINTEFVKEDKKQLFKKLARILSVAAGVMFIVSAALGLCFSYIDWVYIARYVTFGVAILCLLAMLILNSVFTDKEKRDKAQQTARTGGGNASKAAFEFDGTEPTIDDVLADIEKNKNNDKAE